MLASRARRHAHLLTFCRRKSIFSPWIFAWKYIIKTNRTAIRPTARAPYTSFVLSSLPACFITELSTEKAVLFVKYCHRVVFWVIQETFQVERDTQLSQGCVFVQSRDHGHLSTRVLSGSWHCTWDQGSQVFDRDHKLWDRDDRGEIEISGEINRIRDHYFRTFKFNKVLKIDSALQYTDIDGTSN